MENVLGTTCPQVEIIIEGFLLLISKFYLVTLIS